MHFLPSTKYLGLHNSTYQYAISLEASLTCTDSLFSHRSHSISLIRSFFGSSLYSEFQRGLQAFSFCPSERLTLGIEESTTGESLGVGYMILLCFAGLIFSDRILQDPAPY